MHPLPPGHIADLFAPPAFSPAHELERWARETFITEGAPLENEAHAHLRAASIGFLWTNVPMKKHGRAFLGMCELVTETAATWSKARSEHQLRQWFGVLPDGLITIFAPPVEDMSARAFAALIEHELMHLGQKRDQWGQPQFDRATGAPQFAMRAHSFEEFTGVVERYGATSPALRIAAESIMAGPLLGDEEIEIACAACQSSSIGSR